MERVLHIATATIASSLLVACSLLLVPSHGWAAEAAATTAVVPLAAPMPAPVLTPDSIISASIADVPAQYVPPAAPTADVSATPSDDMTADTAPAPPPAQRSPALVKLEVLLDRAGASPGVIDGFDGENLRKAVTAFQIMQGQKPDGVLNPQLLSTLDQPGDSVIGIYKISEDDAAHLVPSIPKDYGEMAQMKSLGYTSIAEELAERFHMDQKFLEALNPGKKFVPGESIYGTVTGADMGGEVTHIEADKAARQVRAYGADGRLLVAYPATIGSTATPSPSGTHTVLAVVHNPTYTYNPSINFKQGNNDKVLTLPPGPNGPVGSIWIDLSEPTFGIHGTPEPSQIDKTASHGCVRLTNWDANELTGMVKKGVTVDFVS